MFTTKIKQQTWFLKGWSCYHQPEGPEGVIILPLPPRIWRSDHASLAHKDLKGWSCYHQPEGPEGVIILPLPLRIWRSGHASLAHRTWRGDHATLAHARTWKGDHAIIITMTVTHEQGLEGGICYACPHKDLKGWSCYYHNYDCYSPTRTWRGNYANHSATQSVSKPSYFSHTPGLTKHLSPHILETLPVPESATLQCELCLWLVTNECEQR